MSQVLISQGDLKNALLYSNRSMQLAKELGYPEVIYRNATTLKRIYRLQNNYKDAFDMYELEVLMRDSINNMSNQKALITQNTKYEYEKKELATKAEQDKKDLFAEEEKQKQTIIRNSFIGGFVLVL